MWVRKHPSEAEIAAVEQAARKMAAGKPDLLDTYRMYYLYNNEVGLYGNRPGNPYRMRRREWIERNVTIKDKRKRVGLMRLNQSQRNKESIILRCERAKVPVRVVTLKVRQNGDSTQTLALAFEYMLRNCNIKVRLIADKEQLCEELLSRAELMLRELSDGDPTDEAGGAGKSWGLKVVANNRDRLAIGGPIYSQIYVISARVPDPGHGETPDMLCMEETSRWPDAERKAKGVELGLPEVHGSYAFDTSTAMGNTGHYHDKFMRAWNRSTGLDTAVDEALLGAGGWRPHFVPWFLHQEYLWSWIFGKAMPKELAKDIRATLDDDEKILLRQKYYLRGVGLKTVSIDQLAWRRYYIREKCNGRLDDFHEQCPAFPHEAFLASGRPAFDTATLKQIMGECLREPGWIGEIGEGIEKGERYTLTPNAKGPLWIWEDPEPGLMYAMGVDTSAGSIKGDPQVFEVIEIESRRQVAEYRGWPSPEDFGRIVTRMSWHYNNADVGIETHPSPHGLRVYDAAEEHGCESLYSQEVYDSIDKRWVRKKGWISSERNKIVLVGRVATALRDGIDLRSERLLNELMDAQLDDSEKVSRNCKNDLMVGLGIALKIRDSAYQEGRAPEPEAPRLDFEQRWWSNRDRQTAPDDGGWATSMEGANTGNEELEELYDGL